MVGVHRIMGTNKYAVASSNRNKIKIVNLTTGDVVAHDRAKLDILKTKSLISGEDHGHIGFPSGGNRLGYDADYTSPDDPFRWSKIKYIIDKCKVDIYGVKRDFKFKVNEIKGGKSSIVDTSLNEMLANGIDVNGLTLLRKSMSVTLTKAVLSPDDRNKVYYDVEQTAGIAANALAHELLGHVWLAEQGANCYHGMNIDKNPVVLDPFGNQYTGSVDTFINRFLGQHINNWLGSPTEHVSASQLDECLYKFKTMSNYGWLTKTKAEPGLENQLMYLENNYAALSALNAKIEMLAIVDGIFDLYEKQLKKELQPMMLALLGKISATYGLAQSLSRTVKEKISSRYSISP